MGLIGPEQQVWMRMCIFRAAGQVYGIPRPAGEFTRRLWACAAPEDRVQHIRVRWGLGRLDIAMLVMASDDDRARAVGARICANALAVDPDTVGWTLRPLD